MKSQMKFCVVELSMIRLGYLHKSSTTSSPSVVLPPVLSVLSINRSISFYQQGYHWTSSMKQLYMLQGCFDWLATPQQVCWLVPELTFELQRQSKQVSVSHSLATIHSLLLQLTDRTNVSWHLCLVSILEGLSFRNTKACVMLIQKAKHGKQILAVITYSWYPKFDTVRCVQGY